MFNIKYESRSEVVTLLGWVTAAGQSLTWFCSVALQGPDFMQTLMLQIGDMRLCHQLQASEIQGCYDNCDDNSCKCSTTTPSTTITNWFDNSRIWIKCWLDIILCLCYFVHLDWRYETVHWDSRQGEGWMLWELLLRKIKRILYFPFASSAPGNLTKVNVNFIT